MNSSFYSLQVKFAPDMRQTPLTKIKTWDNRPVNSKFCMILLYKLSSNCFSIPVTCIANAIPNATIKWFKQNVEVYPSSLYRIIETSSGVSKLFIQPTKLTYDDRKFIFLSFY